eukprot:m.300565 g.300565  ORF g.300565 m.300565 type:complete len:74 (-) comp19558_c0_seq2:170-391(-)
MKARRPKIPNKATRPPPQSQAATLPRVHLAHATGTQATDTESTETKATRQKPHAHTRNTYKLARVVAVNFSVG